MKKTFKVISVILIILILGVLFELRGIVYVGIRKIFCNPVDNIAKYFLMSNVDNIKDVECIYDFSELSSISLKASISLDVRMLENVLQKYDKNLYNYDVKNMIFDDIDFKNIEFYIWKPTTVRLFDIYTQQDIYIIVDKENSGIVKLYMYINNLGWIKV